MDFSKLDTAPETARADDESDRHFIERNVQLISGQREVASQILRIVANALIYIDQAGGQGKTRWPGTMRLRRCWQNSKAPQMAQKQKTPLPAIFDGLYAGPSFWGGTRQATAR